MFKFDFCETPENSAIYTGLILRNEICFLSSFHEMSLIKNIDECMISIGKDKRKNINLTKIKTSYFYAMLL